ncbi:restriction endonuclease [Agrococcus beijingensis]|uniref:restriction endonuclease n=1 Tax=Agrococcus beijingensis TaxID=3068634 RepID=UPI0027422D47|nr:restriction endonuclease [Agrococcus sp. REN33]
MTAWVVRAGKHGENEQHNLQRGRVTVGWADTGELSRCRSREDVRARLEVIWPGMTQKQLGNFTGQLWAFRDMIQPGDLMLLPLKTKPGYIQFGRVTGDYAFDATEPEPTRRHFRPVEWLGEPVARAVIDEDLLLILGAYLTVFSPSRNNAAERLEAIAETGSDPGLGASAVPEPAPRTAESEDSADVTDPELVPTLETIRDRVRSHVAASFREHRLTGLVADILTVLGYHCEVSPPGPDGGVDILAGRGPLGLDSRIVVEVKSEPSPIGASVVRGLHSAWMQHQAQQGLLVAWGGLTKPAASEFKKLTWLRVWDAEALLEKLFETYEHLPAATKEQIPLRQVWVLDDDETRDA